MITLVHSFHVTLVYIALASVLVLADGSHDHNIGRRHHALNLTAVNLTERDTHFEKRFDNTRFTFFDPGINACGSYDQDDDFIVALNVHQWNGGSHCYDTITISYQGRSRKAKITDMCPTCPYGALDLGPSLFLALVPGGFDQGVAYGSWYFGSGEEESEPDPPPKTTTKKKHTSTTTKARPTSTSTRSKTSTKHSTTKTKTTTSSKTTKTSSSTTRSSTTTSSTSSAPTATFTSFDTGNINQFNLAILQLIGLSQAQTSDEV